MRPHALAALLVLVVLGPPATLRAAPQRIEVRVVDEQKQPLAGIPITVAAVTGDDFAVDATSDDRGLVSLELPTAERVYRLRIAHPEWAEFEREFDLGASPSTRRDVVRLEATLTRPGHTDRFNRAVHAYRAGDLAAAESELRVAVELAPDFAKGWSVLALVLLDQKRPEGALAAADRAVVAAPDDAEPLRLRYDALVALGRTDDAEAALDALVARDGSPALARVLFNSGATAANAGRPELARRRLGEAIARDPALWQVHSALAELAIREQNLEGALGDLERALALVPREARLWQRKLEVLRALGRGEEAAEAERRLAELADEP